MSAGKEKFTPALAYDWLTGLFDPAVRLTARETTFKTALLEQAELQPGMRVLDIGCGTGTLLLMAWRRQQAAELIGLDADAAILRRARTKADSIGAGIHVDRGMSDHLPYDDACFDRVLSSLFFHHLTRAGKLATLAEIKRVLKPGASVHIADWGEARNPLARAAFLPVQLLDGFETTADNVRGMLPRLLEDSGFVQVDETKRFATVFGVLSLYRAMKG